MKGSLRTAGRSRIVFTVLFAGLLVILAGGSAFAQAAWPITASSGGYGAISPGGIVYATNGAPQSFAFIPNPGYMVYQVIVDGNAVAADAAGFTFGAVFGPHSILVTFTPAVGGVIVVPAPGVYLFGGDYDRRRDVEEFRRRGIESRRFVRPGYREVRPPVRREERRR